MLSHIISRSVYVLGKMIRSEVTKVKLVICFYRPRVRECNIFILPVYLCICLPVWAITFECLYIEHCIFGMVGHHDHTQVQFEYQGDWVKDKCTLVKWAFWTVEHQIHFCYDQLMVKYNHQGQDHCSIQAGSWLLTENILVILVSSNKTSSFLDPQELSFVEIDFQASKPGPTIPISLC